MHRRVVMVVVLLALALLALFIGRHDAFENQRARYVELNSLLAKIRQNFTVFYLGRGRFPRSNAEADLPPADTLTLGPVEGVVVMGDERLMLRLRVAADQVATVFLTPEMNTADQFLWHCRSPDLPERLREALFGGCRPSAEYLTLEKAMALQARPAPKPAPAQAPPPAPSRSAEPRAELTRTCELPAAAHSVLLHETGLGLWDLADEPRLLGFLAHDVQRADGFHAQVGDTLFAVVGNAIVFADTRTTPLAWQSAGVWVKPGTRVYGVGNRLAWVTPEYQLFVGDICQLPAIRIIHTMKLDLGRREQIVRLYAVDDLVYLLSRYEGDWGNRSELNIYRMKDNGTLLHRFHFRLDGLANGMHLSEPHLVVANGRQGVFFYARTLDQRWQLAQKLSAVDYAMDVLLQGDTLWVADGAAGVLHFARDGAGQWQRVGQQLFDFPAFHLRPLARGLLVSSATRHAWYDPVSGRIKALEPAPAVSGI